MITVSKEDYLKAILEAESEGETVISATLAHWLKVSPPAVTMALRRLKKDGFVRVQTDGQVRLTAVGRKIARRLTLRQPRLRGQTPRALRLGRRVPPWQSLPTRKPCESASARPLPAHRSRSWRFLPS